MPAEEKSGSFGLPDGSDSLSESDLDDIFGYEGPDGWVMPKVPPSEELRPGLGVTTDSASRDIATTDVDLNSPNGMQKRPFASTTDSQVTCPEGWWVPEIRPAQMAVEGSAEMTAMQYRQAFVAKLAAAIEKEGKKESRKLILSMLEPFHQDQFMEDANPEDWAETLLGVLVFPLASPESSLPASKERAEQAVEAQPDLTLGDLISAGMN